MRLTSFVLVLTVGISTVSTFRSAFVPLGAPVTDDPLIIETTSVATFKTSDPATTDTPTVRALKYTAAIILGILASNIISYLLHCLLPRITARALACLPPSTQRYLLPLLLFYLPIAVMCCCMRKPRTDEEHQCQVELEQLRNEVNHLSDVVHGTRGVSAQQPIADSLIVL